METKLTLGSLAVTWVEAEGKVKIAFPPNQQVDLYSTTPKDDALRIREYLANNDVVASYEPFWLQHQETKFLKTSAS